MTSIYQEYCKQFEAIIDKNCHKYNFKDHKQSKRLTKITPRGKCADWFCQFNVSRFRIKPK